VILCEQVARMSVATCGIIICYRRRQKPGCRYAHPGYACCYRFDRDNSILLMCAASGVS
jgi:hypothetical protein